MKPQYKWASPLDWLNTRSNRWTKKELHDTLIQVASKLDSDTLQDCFETEMYKDGYFEEERG